MGRSFVNIKVQVSGDFLGPNIYLLAICALPGPGTAPGTQPQTGQRSPAGTGEKTEVSRIR